MLFALDEVANIAPLGELPQIASEGGGQGLTLLAALQDLSQARARWGKAADGFLTLFGTKLMLPGIADTNTLEAVSTMLGEYDRQVVSTAPATPACSPTPGQADPDGVHPAHPRALARRDRRHPRRPGAAPRRHRLGAPHPHRRAPRRAVADAHHPGRIMTTTSVRIGRLMASRGRDVLRTSCPQHCQCVECVPGSVERTDVAGVGAAGVLIVAKITQGTAGGYAEYLEGKARASELGDYYLKDGERVEAPGRWAAGAHLFGMDADVAVTGEQLRTLMDVRRPDTGGSCAGSARSGEAVAALDATFSAPKSVSAVWALGSPELRERIEQPRTRSRSTARSTTRSGTSRCSASAWTRTRSCMPRRSGWSRRAGGTPRLAPWPIRPRTRSCTRTSCCTPRIRRDGRLVAIDSRTWLQHQREVGAAYRTELARELATLGFAVERGTGRGERYFELAGVPQPLLDRWSSRHHQVQAAIRDRLSATERDLRAVIAEGGPAAAGARERLELLLANGQLAPAEERLMGTITRAGKVAVTAADLDAEWRRTARGIGFTPERVEVLRRQQRQPLTPAAPDGCSTR